MVHTTQCVTHSSIFHFHCRQTINPFRVRVLISTDGKPCGSFHCFPVSREGCKTHLVVRGCVGFRFRGLPQVSPSHLLPGDNDNLVAGQKTGASFLLPSLLPRFLYFGVFANPVGRKVKGFEVMVVLKFVGPWVLVVMVLVVVVVVVVVRSRGVVVHHRVAVIGGGVLRNPFLFGG